jgi:hypothetical protein
VYRGARHPPGAGCVYSVVHLPTENMISLDGIAKRIVWLRGEKVLLDADLAKLYGVTTTRLNEQVKPCGTVGWILHFDLRIMSLRL